MEIINKTPHPIVILNDQEEVLMTIPKGESLIRLKQETIQVGEIGGVKTSKTVFGKPEGLPEYKENTYYVVSQIIKSALPERADLLVPAEIVRDKNGNILGCKSLGL